MSTAAIYASDVEQDQSVSATKLRDLDGFEEYMWLMEHNTNLSHSVVVEVRGATTMKQWRDALSAVQARHPLLSASIRKIPGQRPFFEKVHGSSIPLRIVPLTDWLVLEEEMESELAQSFGDGSGPLTRATLFHAKDRSIILFTTHHSSLDGKSHLLLIQDLMADMGGEELGEPLALQPGMGQLLGLPAPAPYVKKLKGRSVASGDGTRLELPKIRVQHRQLGENETTALLRRSKEENTTVHAALVTALALAGKRYSKAWELGPIRCMSPIDMRKTLMIPDAAGLLISAHSGRVPLSEGASFWDIARAVKEDMLPAQSLDGARYLLGSFSSIVAEEHGALDLYRFVRAAPLRYELMVTNYAGYKVRTEYGNLKIENLFTGSAAVSDIQKVSVITTNGKLGMTLVARDLFPTLLEDAREILVHA
ncbi:condensation domain-containing protein [Granulicella mallensis]|uniref:Phthiocerol/phthiodiolone dimycocerosyl transferase n=1 Tax=Granulicella mallensis (strain ATCC BAA-1857 / DSM 23137 / MP5ACTX8) TaxID=682795 RepID=G8P072_GRAMM|nr:condensation domain-containing protein [Granulicella mallensis]AEU36866.1 condensation domain protein [Granulicella mallensis MP5ACTX8]